MYKTKGKLPIVRYTTKPESLYPISMSRKILKPIPKEDVIILKFSLKTEFEVYLARKPFPWLVNPAKYLVYSIPKLKATIISEERIKTIFRIFFLLSYKNLIRTTNIQIA